MTPDELKAWRVKHNMSQGDLALALGVSRLTVAHWEQEKVQQKPPPYLELALCELHRRHKPKKDQPVKRLKIGQSTKDPTAFMDKWA